MKDLVTVEWFHEHLYDENIVLLDASVKTSKDGKYTSDVSLTLPNARFFDLKNVMG